MSDKPIPTPPSNLLSKEQIESISGGFDCSGSQLVELANNLTKAYEGLIDFTSHVFERIAN
jgi:hypothetical protein